MPRSKRRAGEGHAQVNANTRNKAAHVCMSRSNRQASDGHALYRHAYKLNANTPNKKTTHAYHVYLVLIDNTSKWTR